MAIYVAIPVDLETEDFDRIHHAMRARGYVAPHSEPSMLDEMTPFTARLALADPVDQQEVTVSASVAQLLWRDGIPFGVEGGNSHSLIIPRRAVARARALLASVVPSETRWRH